MAVRASKELIHRKRECNFVLSAFQTEGDHVAEALTGFNSSTPEVTNEDPGYASVFRNMGGRLETSLDDLVAADRKLMSAVGWESTLRKEHREKSEDQGFVLVGLRGAVIAQYVEPDLENLALQPIDVRDSVTVSHRSRVAADRFEAPNLVQMLGRERFGVAVDFTPYVAQLRSSAEDLTRLQGQINEAERRTARVRLEKNRTQDEHDKLVLRSARVFEDFCRLAGFDELADRIRRTIPSRSSSQEPAVVEPAVVEPAVGEPAVGEPAVGEPAVGEPALGETGEVAESPEA